MVLPINLDQFIAICSLLVAAIVAVAGARRSSKANVDMLRKEAERQQHGTQITRLEAKVDEQERRITVLEKRCERHFGETQHNDI